MVGLGQGFAELRLRGWGTMMRSSRLVMSGSYGWSIFLVVMFWVVNGINSFNTVTEMYNSVSIGLFNHS